MATTASRHGADPGGSSDRATASAASRTAAAMSASSSTTSSTLTTAVMSRAARCSSRRRYAAASAATGSSLASWLATGSARRGLAPTASSICSRSSAGPGRPRLPRSSWHVFGVPGQVVGQAGADAEDGGQPVAELGFVAQRLPQGGPVVGGAEQPGQPGQGQVGIGRGGQRGQQRVGARLAPLLVRIGAAEVGEQQALGPRGVRETQPGQSPGQRGPRAAHASKGNRRVDPRGTRGALANAWLGRMPRFPRG